MPEVPRYPDSVNPRIIDAIKGKKIAIPNSPEALEYLYSLGFAQGQLRPPQPDEPVDGDYLFPCYWDEEPFFRTGGLWAGDIKMPLEEFKERVRKLMGWHKAGFTNATTSPPKGTSRKRFYALTLQLEKLAEQEAEIQKKFAEVEKELASYHNVKIINDGCSARLIEAGGKREIIRHYIEGGAS